MSEQEEKEFQELHAALAERDADIRAVAVAVKDALSALDLKPETFKEGMNIAGVVSGIMPKLMTGDIDPTKFASLAQIPTIIEKYEYLYEDL